MSTLASEALLHEENNKKIQQQNVAPVTSAIWIWCSALLVIWVFHNYTKLAMLALLPTLYLQFSSLFTPTDVNKYEIRIQGLHALLD